MPKKTKPIRSDLRLDDLRKAGHYRAPTKLMNLKIPAKLSDAIATVARELGVSKTELVIALFNEGLDADDEKMKGWKAPKRPESTRICRIRNCEKDVMAKGLCAAHYQRERRGR